MRAALADPPPGAQARVGAVRTTAPSIRMQTTSVVLDAHDRCVAPRARPGATDTHQDDRSSVAFDAVSGAFLDDLEHLRVGVGVLRELHPPGLASHSPPATTASTVGDTRPGSLTDWRPRSMAQFMCARSPGLSVSPVTE
jgi:hypothetical protein